MLVSCSIRATLALLALAASPASFAAAFTAGNLVVYRVGDGVGVLANTGNAVFLDEFTPSGTLVQSVALPTAVTGANLPLIASGTATSEGLLSRSSDGRYLLATGYGRAIGLSGSLSSTTAIAVPRVIGRIAFDGTIDTTTALTDYADGNNPRSATSVDGSGFWAAGGAGGTRYAPLGASTSTPVTAAAPTNLRQLNVFSGQLYVTTSSGSTVRLGAIGSGTPSTSGQAITSLSGIPAAAGSPYAFFFADLDSSVAGIDTLYIADDSNNASGGVLKYSLVAGAWTSNGLMGAGTDAYRGLAGKISGNTVSLFATRKGGTGAAGGGELVVLSDTAGYNATPNGVPATIATATTNTAFRGIAPAPVAPPLGPLMRITEYMYSGANGEFVEFTNVGDQPANLAGWSFDDSHQVPGAQSLGAFGTVQPGESVVLTESVAGPFRSAWGLCAGIKVIGGLTANLGRNDEINLYAANNALVDRLTFGDDVTVPGSIRTQNASGWAQSAAIGVNNILLWTLSSNGDAEASVASTGLDVGSPGRSRRAIVDYDACVAVAGTPSISTVPAVTSAYLDLGINGGGAASGVLADPTDPAASIGIGLALADSDGDPTTLTVDVTSSNPAVVPSAGLIMSGSGATRTLRIVPSGVGTTTINVSATDADLKTGVYSIAYGASAASLNPSTTRFHTGSSDASTAIALDAQHMLVGDDENQALRLYRRDQSGLHLTSFDYTAALALTDLSGGMPREIDIEGSTRLGNRIFWIGSHGNQATGSNAARPNRRRVFATDLSNAGALSSLAFAGRYDFLAEDLIAWDQANANALGLTASAAAGVSPEIASGLNIEGLTMAADGITAYVAFRAPRESTVDRSLALIIPVLGFDTLVTGAAPTSRPQGSATFGTPILLDLGGRAIRSIERNVHNQYLIVAGPSGTATGIAPNDFRLFLWSGNAADAPLLLNADLTALQAGGSVEGIVQLPDTLGPATEIQLTIDNGDTVYYANGTIAKDLSERRLAKFRSERISVDFPSEILFIDGFE